MSPPELADIIRTFSISSGAGAAGGFVAGLSAPGTNCVRLFGIRRNGQTHTAVEVELGFLGDMLIGAAAGIAIVFFIYLGTAQPQDGLSSLLRLIPISLMAGVVSKRALTGMANAVIGKLVSDTAHLKEEQNRLQDRLQKLSSLRDMVREGEEYLQQGSEEKLDRARRIGKYESARDKFLKALEIDHAHPGANVSLGRALKRLAEDTSDLEGRKRLLQEAIEATSKAIISDPGYERAYYNRACYKALMGAATPEVIADLEKAIQLFNQNRLFADGDSDFQAIREDSRFRAIVEGPEAKARAERAG
jgi:tetratricopeptide (TPR) repeat protein